MIGPAAWNTLDSLLAGCIIDGGVKQVNIEHIPWSKSEKAISRRAFDLAYERECSAIVDELRQLEQQITTPRQIWAIQEYLLEKRKETDGKYDFRYSQLLLLFGILIDEGWISEADLAGLSEDKLSEIRDVVQFRNR